MNHMLWLNLRDMFSYLDLHIEIDSETQLRITIYEKEIISSFPLRTLYLYVATFQQHMHMEPFRNSQPGYGGHREPFEVMTTT
jgi:hypothetical protein